MEIDSKRLANEVYDVLTELNETLETFHNKYHVNQLLNSNSNLDPEYIKDVMKHLRLLEAYAFEGLRTIKPFINQQEVEHEQLEHILKGIFLKCVNAYFSPDSDIWFEDSRASYYDKASLDFVNNPGDEISELIKSIEPYFHKLRNDLDYFDYHAS